MNSKPPLLSVQALTTHFARQGGHRLVAVEEVSFDQQPGETIGVVGESGCGKSTLARSVLRLITPTSGQVLFQGEDLGDVSKARMRAIRREMQIIFQDPFASLDPRMRIGAMIEEPLLIHKAGDAAARRDQVAFLLETVGLDADAARRYPHEFSGGQRQRIGIARAIALQPKLVIADEPVSALDVSIQAQILNLLRDLQQRFDLAYMFISHDLAVVRHMSEKLAVMYLGRFVEYGAAETIYTQARHPYTQSLIAAVLEPDPKKRRQRGVVRGDVPNPEQKPKGCPFHPRCPRAMVVCREHLPLPRDLGMPDAPHLVSCHLY